MSVFPSSSRNPNLVVLQAGKLYRVPPDPYSYSVRRMLDWDELDGDNLVFVCSVVGMGHVQEVVLIDSRGVVWKGHMDHGSYYHKRFWEIDT
jgi:hypothetical protein